MAAGSAVTEEGGPGGRYLPLDGLVVAYTAWVALLVAVLHRNVSGAGRILVFHLLLIAAVALIPRRGSAWEKGTEGETRVRRYVRGGARFFRHGYPLLLVLFFFEEVQRTVNAVHPESPYWFEPHLYAADRFVFGEIPAVLLNPHVGPIQDEIAHAFYLSYYFILIGGVVLAWFGPRGNRRHPGAGFQTTLTAAIAAFFLCFVWYPFLPARGPWENPELMSRMTPFSGFVFTPLIEVIIERGAVSGGCFPSSHVAGSFGVVFGLFRFQRKPAVVLGVLALGMSFACVYTRYHHGVDVPAGLLAGLAGALVARGLERRESPLETP